MTPQAFFKRSTLYFISALILLAATVFYGVVQFQNMYRQTKAIADNEVAREELSQEFGKTEAAYKVFAEERMKKQEELAKNIENILPSDENYTDFTRQLDDYFDENDRPGNPILQGSLHFGKGAPVQSVEDVSALSFSMNLEATRDNFFKFLNFVNNSGSLEGGARLMDIISIQLNFPEGGEILKDAKQKISFNVEMNAYYKTLKVAR